MTDLEAARLVLGGLTVILLLMVGRVAVWAVQDARRTWARRKPPVAVIPLPGECQYRFGGTINRCLTQPSHAIHRGKWPGPEENHAYLAPQERHVHDWHRVRVCVVCGRTR